MEDLEDAHGHIFWDVLTGIDAFGVIERDDGYIDTFAARDYFGGYHEWPSHERKAVRSVRGSVLDIGCGAGRHSLYLQERGHNVTGIDISPLCVKVCEGRGLRKALVMSASRLDFKPNSFDTILLLGNNFGLLAGRTKAGTVLKRLHAVTTRDARIVAETLDPYDTKEPAHLIYHERNRSRGRMAGQVRIRVRYRQYKSGWFDYLFVSQEEMKDLLRETGWRVRRFYESHCPQYVAILEKS